MSIFVDYMSASDSDIYDLLVSSKQRLTEAVLQGLARDRGIFCSARESREDLADYLSILPHAYQDIEGILQRREPLHRREKTASTRLKADIPLEELKAAADEYAKSVAGSEGVVHRPKGNGFQVSVTYDEFNHSRTRLLQRERHEAVIEFINEGGEVVIRRPATEKAKRIAEAIKGSVERKRKTLIEAEAIELVGLASPGARSKFFTKLISSLEGFKLMNVMNLKVSSADSEDEGDDYGIDLEDPKGENAASQEMLAAVHSMSLSGNNLVQSREYRDLTSRGFFITSISWRSERVGANNEIVQFEAGFEDRKLGTGFRYSVQGVFRLHKGAHRKVSTPVNEVEKIELFELLEKTARKILVELREEGDSGTPTGERAAG
ncbi:MAG TPA: hypothetical protein VD978_37100 [Azospirillum sp.]|nr:hypothetical protein [Azospirillum sp.]